MHDSDTILDIASPIESIVIIGSGAIGTEYASIMAALGVRVTLLEAGPRVLRIADADMSAELARCMTAADIEIRTGTTTTSIIREDGRLVVTLSTGETLNPAKVLFAVGRAANTDGLGLREIGVATDHRGTITVDDRFRTSVPTVFAAGDVVGPPGLASVSIEQGRIAASAACGTSYTGGVRYVAPSGVYPVPEVAWAAEIIHVAQAVIQLTASANWSRQGSCAQAACTRFRPEPPRNPRRIMQSIVEGSHPPDRLLLMDGSAGDLDGRRVLLGGVPCARPSTPGRR